MTAIAEREYVELLRQNPPRVIRSDEEFDKFDAVIRSLPSSSESLDEASAEYVTLVTVLMERYEAENHVLPQPTPLDTLHELMLANDMTQADLARLVGSRGTASEIFRGGRSISKNLAKKLAERFNVSPALFI